MDSFEHVIIFVSKRPNYYNFGTTPFYTFRVPDVDNYDDMPEYFISAFKDFLDRNICENHTVYVCCDAGISRSPAVAKFILYYFGINESWIDNLFANYNKALYKKLKESIK